MIRGFYINEKMKNLIHNFTYFTLYMITSLLFAKVVHSQSYSQTTGYLIQRVETLKSYYFIPLRHGLTLPLSYEFYIANEDKILTFLSQDSVILGQTTMLCDPADVMFSDSATSKEALLFTRLIDILRLDDSEIYIIGNEKYIIRKIRYAYYDNSQVKVYIRDCDYSINDDVQDEDSAEFNAIYEVGNLYGRDYYQCFHHLMEILPTPEYITSHLWKRLYQIGEDEQKNNKGKWYEVYMKRITKMRKKMIIK